MKLNLDLQNPTEESAIPEESKIHDWIVATLSFLNWQASSAEITVRVVGKQEIQLLNKTYRNKDKTTNILSFPFEAPEYIESDLLGDLVICHEVLVEETKQQNKVLQNHWTHMVIHGILHLLGFDHIEDSEANEMESIEIKLLEKFNIDNPYFSESLDIKK